MMGLSQPNSNLTYVFQRDIGNALKLIIGEALAITELWIKELPVEEHQACMEELGIIASSLGQAYIECVTDHYNGLSTMVSIFKRAHDRGPAGQKVAAQFCMFVFTSLFGYLFTCREYTIGILKELDLGTFNYSSLVQLLMMVPIEDRKKMLVSLKESGTVGSRWDYSPLVKHIDGFREVFEKRYLSTEKKDTESKASAPAETKA